MASKNYLFPTEILRDISNGILNLDEIFFSELYLHVRWLFLVEFIVKQSVLNLEDYYKTCVLLSYKTSNSQHDIDNMPYWVFNNFVAYLNEILEEENKGSGNSGDGNEQYQTAMQQHQQMFKQSQSNFKSMMGGGIPKLK